MNVIMEAQFHILTENQRNKNEAKINVVQVNDLKSLPTSPTE